MFLFQSISLGTMQLQSALSFVDMFPEARGWDVCIAEQNKKPLLYAPQMSAFELRRRLKDDSWLNTSVHVFIRPLMNNVVFLDLDKFPGGDALAHLHSLQPRAIVRTSQSNLQAWLTLPPALSEKDTLEVAGELNAWFKGDTNSLRKGQHGRMPGKSAHFAQTHNHLAEARQLLQNLTYA